MSSFSIFHWLIVIVLIYAVFMLIKALKPNKKPDNKFETAKKVEDL
jgi:hypothetical protein